MTDAASTAVATTAPVRTPRRGASRATTGERLASAGFAIACLAVLVAAASLKADAAGHGTHTQLGLPPCGWAMSFGKPCPTCGMTTAVTHAVQGRLLESLETQPFGLVVAVLSAVGFWVTLHTALTGSRLVHWALGALRPRVLWALAALASLAWAYKWVTWRG